MKALLIVLFLFAGAAARSQVSKTYINSCLQDSAKPTLYVVNNHICDPDKIEELLKLWTAASVSTIASVNDGLFRVVFITGQPVLPPRNPYKRIYDKTK